LEKVRNHLTILLMLALILMSVLTLACSSAPATTPTAPSKPASSPLAPVAPTKVQFLGQSCFMITSSTGLKVIIDPYTTNEKTYSAIDETADIVTVSHEHADHNNVAGVKGNPEVIKGSGIKNIKGINFKGVAVFHDDAQGAQRGANTIFCFSLDGVKFCHVGDLGHRLSPEQIAEIGAVDVFFVPVGGFFTIDAKVATDVCNDLKPKIIIPMHYKTPKSNPNLSGIEDFLTGKQNVKQLNTSILEFNPKELPAGSEVFVLQMAR
jgi:L-ascorbate metabolism protein UlaG (beta-lactamase superfamily)